MKFTWKFPIVLLLIAFVFLSSVCYYPANGKIGTSAQDVPFFGVTFGGNTTSEAKLLIDKVKGYTNLFVVDNWDVGMNETLLTDICDYAVAAGLHIIVYFDFLLYPYNGSVAGIYNSTWNIYGVKMFHIEWLNHTKERWGDNFLGVYLADEPGGNQIDSGYWTGDLTTLSGRPNTAFANVSSYSDAANRHVRLIRRGSGMNWLVNSSYAGSIPNTTGRSIPVFTADNALYWWDYLAGYNVVFAELGWNHNEAQHIGLCRGAANVQGKDWGAIITWATNDPPYLPSGTQMLEELNAAYDAGAQYLIVFNYPQINLYGALLDEHFEAMEAFWVRMHSSPRNGLLKADVAVVLPKDYGWGMRQASDRIWGLWEADALAPQIGAKIATLIKQYGFNLDIIFDDSSFNFTDKYSTIYYWNGTTTQSPQSFFNIPVSHILYPSLAIIAIVLTCTSYYFVIRKKKRHPPSRQLSLSVRC
jgi:hypothetical protein